MSAQAVRKWAIVLAPVTAGVLAVVGTLADPVPQASGEELVRAYAENPDRVQIKSVAYHFSYALWLVTVFPLVGVVRRRGGWLANVAGALAFLGISTIPGFLVADFVDSAMGRIVGPEAAVRVGDLAQQGWGFKVIQVPGLLGFLLALPVAALAAWRAGVLPWWAFVAPTLGIAAFMGFGATLPGNILLTVAFAVFSLALSKVDFGRSEPELASAQQ